ncbi:hypothetical protein ACIGXM_11370 [Kitasatospora sp. NPDC052896]|uniref:hypothetical protein n=1 Tax=Kitasatospora sp. NPDC052896 TaxID=3364061 RepID=UPI0037CA1C24
MSDLFELMVTVDLGDELSEQEIAELRWHLGLGPQPERLTIVTAFPFVVEDDAGNPVVEDEPYPLLAERGAAARVGGALCSALASRADLPRRGWSLTSRQEVHPDDFEKVGELLCWLAARAHDTHLLVDHAVWIGYLRFHEDLMPEVLEIKNGLVNWPA